MKTYVALLRAVNVGGTSLPMADLRRLCEELGFDDVRTYIQSGNVVLRSALSAARVQKELETAVAGEVGKPVGVIVRTGSEIASALARNPFPDERPNRVVVVFLPAKAPADAAEKIVAPGGERVVVDGSDVFVHYPDGQGNSKLRLPFAKEGTARNLNTVARLAEMVAAG